MTERQGGSILPRPVVLALILLGLPAAGAADPAAGGRIFFYFDPSAGDQVDRAAAIHRLTRDLPGVEWTAVTPFPAPAPGMAAASLAELVSDPSTPRTVIPWLRARAAGADHLLIERRGETFDGPGTEALAVIEAAGLDPGPGPSTDVDVTTWGKVKDLFQ